MQAGCNHSTGDIRLHSSCHLQKPKKGAERTAGIRNGSFRYPRGKLLYKTIYIFQACLFNRLTSAPQLLKKTSRGCNITHERCLRHAIVRFSVLAILAQQGRQRWRGRFIAPGWQRHAQALLCTSPRAERFPADGLSTLGDSSPLQSPPDIGASKAVDPNRCQLFSLNEFSPLAISSKSAAPIGDNSILSCVKGGLSAKSQQPHAHACQSA